MVSSPSLLPNNSNRDTQSNDMNSQRTLQGVMAATTRCCCVALALLGLLATPAAAAPVNSDLPYLGPENRPLPFADDNEALSFLTFAKVVETKRLKTGINKALKLTLELNGVRANAVFRTVDLEIKPSGTYDRPHPRTFRDSYRFEKAAYELSRLFGLGTVPPTVVRSIDGREGTLQLWVEQASTEAGLLEQGPLTHAGTRHLQKTSMLVFDNLIYNFDRHQNNFLYDTRGNIWYIDHTRSFRGLPELLSKERLAVVDRQLLMRLRQVEPALIKKTLKPYLDFVELDALLKRRKQLLKRFDQLIEERGEHSVLLDVGKSVAQTWGDSSGTLRS